jgi:signal transduction histidine kinase
VILARLLKDRRDALVARWLDKVRATLRSERPLDDDEVRDSLHFFIDELILAVERGDRLPEAGRGIAEAHGAQRHLLKRDIADVVREYGLFFECVAEECPVPLPPEEWAVLADALNAGAALAVREYATLRDMELRRQAAEHFGFLAHEIRNPLQTARLALDLLGTAPAPRGIDVLRRSLARMSETLDRALVDARMRGLDSGATLHREHVEVRALLEEAIAESQPDAEARKIAVTLQAPPKTFVEADARVLRSALTNLLRNAIKFTRSGGAVAVRAGPAAIEIEDECGGLDEDDEKRIFDTFRQTGADRSGFGLGLTIARQAIAAHGWSLNVRNLPGKGCVFAVSLT